MRKLGVAILIAFLALLGVSLTGNAQEQFPNRPVYIIVGHGAGGSTDIVARSFATFLSEELKVPVVVKNITGAGADIANNYVWRSKPDGYTLSMTVIPSYLVRELIKKENYEILKMSFLYGVAGGDYNAIAVPANSPIKTFADLKALAARRSLTVGGTTRGSNSWFAYLMLRQETGIKFKYVPYNSGTRAALAAVGGHVDLTVASIISLVQPAKNKELRIIAGFSDKRDPMFPDVPMMVELGYKDLHFATFQGLLGPPGLPKQVVDTLEAAAAKAVRNPKLKEIADKQGFTLHPMTGPEFYKLAVSIHDHARKVLGQAGELVNSKGMP